MALLKKHTTDYGLTVEYHKVGSLSYSNGNLSFALDSYVSQDFRADEKIALSRYYNIVITVEEEESMGIRQLAYKKLKELPNWEDAEDC